MTETHTTDAAIEQAIDSYFSAWNEPENGARATFVAAAFTRDARYVDPLSDATGHEAISAAMGDARQQYPGITVSRTSAVDSHHDMVRFSWSITSADGAVLIDGIDVARTEGGLMADMRGFFGREIA